ncbi:MAG: hypothetical protein J7K72_00270 [Candidatus Aenigmarchaeota archaeon]|nr:hypothetical protein [Candidatus Aenigmarchaeota archaeon]
MLGDGIRLKSWRQLADFLRIWGINEGRVKEIWKSMEKPMLLSRIYDWYGIPQNIYLLKLVEVWENDNTRIALWNNRTVMVMERGEWAYDYLRKGFYRIGMVIIRTRKLTDEIIGKIKRHIKTHRGVLTNPFIRTALTLRQLKRLLEGSGIKAEESPSVEENKEFMKELSKRLEYTRITEKGFMIKGRLLGVVGRKVWEYVDFSSFLHETDMRPIEETEWIVNRFIEDVLNNLTGEQKLRMGRITVRFKIGKNILVEERKVFRENLEYLVIRGLEAKKKEEFIKLRDELQKIPFILRKFLKNGFVITVKFNQDYTSPTSFIIRLGVEYKRGKVYFVSPISGKRVMLNTKALPWRVRSYGSLGILLENLEMLMEQKDLLSVFYVLARLFGKEEVFKIMDLGRKSAKEAEKQATKLLDEILEKYRGRIIETVHDGDKGYVVKGRIRNYFVDKRTGEVRTWPDGSDICVTEDGGKYVTCTDRVISRILLLLNDDKLRTKVTTLNREEVNEIILINT